MFCKVRNVRYARLSLSKHILVITGQSEIYMEKFWYFNTIPAIFRTLLEID